MATANGLRLLTATISMPRTGAPHFDLDVDTTDPLAGAVSVELDGVTFSGTVVRSGVHGGRVQARVVGGKGGLSRELPAKNYAPPDGVPARIILEDILRGAGEALSGTVDAALLETTFARWHREQGPASWALVALADSLGSTWRVLADGTVWVGVDTYPEQTLEHVLIDERWDTGDVVIAPEAPELRPGVTFRGQRVEHVDHFLSAGKLRTEARPNSISSTLDRILGHVRRRIDYSRTYAARVALQNSDGTLQLVPDNPLMKGAGLDRVPMRFGIPGVTAELVPGARVRFTFDGGSPAAPYVFAYEAGAEVLSMQITAELELKLKGPAVRLGANPDAAAPLAAGSASQPSASVQITTP